MLARVTLEKPLILRVTDAILPEPLTSLNPQPETTIAIRSRMEGIYIRLFMRLFLFLHPPSSSEGEGTEG
jgi:hypothetical protein